MQHLIIILIAIFFCLSCSSDNSTNNAVIPKIDSIASASKDEEEFFSSEEKETTEKTCLITNISEENGQVFIHADYIQRLEGERAIEEAKKRGDADTAVIDGNIVIGIVNDYYTINDNSKIRMLPLDPAVKFELLYNPERFNGKVENTIQGLQLIYKNSPYKLTIRNGRVIKVFEIFVP